MRPGMPLPDARFISNITCRLTLGLLVSPLWVCLPEIKLMNEWTVMFDYCVTYNWYIILPVIRSILEAVSAVVDLQLNGSFCKCAILLTKSLWVLYFVRQWELRRRKMFRFCRATSWSTELQHRRLTPTAIRFILLTYLPRQLIVSNNATDLCASVA